MKTLAILLLLSTQARAEHVSCHDLRKYIAWYGKAAVEEYAVVVKGYTREEISRIRKMCGI